MYVNQFSMFITVYWRSPSFSFYNSVWNMMIVESVYDPESNLQGSGPTYEVWFNSNDAKCLCYSSEVNAPNLVLMVLKYLFNTMQIQA